MRRRGLFRIASVFGSAVCAAVLGTAGTAYAQGPPYTFQRIDFPGAAITEVSGINNAGKVVGTYFNADGTSHGFLFDGTTYSTIDFPGSSFNYLFGIGNSGQIVGSYSLGTTFGPYHGLVVDGSTFTTVDFPTQETDIRAINASGQLVGIYDASVGMPDHGFMKSGSTLTSIDVAGAKHTYAFGLTDAGKVSGTYVDASNRYHGWTWSGGTFTFVEYPGGSHTFVGGINNSDTVVGWTVLPSTRVTGFILKNNSYRAFNVTFAGATTTVPRSINDLGEIVGTYNGGDCLASRCSFIARPTATTSAICSQALAMSYAPTTLTLSTTLQTSTPLTWDMWLFVAGTPLRLWSLPIPAIPSQGTLNVPIPGVPSIGTVFGLSMLSTSSGDAMCVDIASVNTSS